MPTPHKHAATIKAWADGHKIQVYSITEGWVDTNDFPCWVIEDEYRIKPAAPKWPQTTMTHKQFEGNFIVEGAVNLLNEKSIVILRVFANAVIAHECSTGALVPADKVREIEEKARAKAGILVAREIQKSVRILGHHSDSELRGLVEEILSKEAE